MRLVWQRRGSVDHELIWGSVALVIVVGAALVPVDRIMGLAGYVCPFRAVTGLPCPFCYGTRAFVAMGSLRFREGFALNPLAALLWFGAVLWVPYALVACVFDTKRLRVTGVTDRQRRAAVLVLALLVAGNWVYLVASR